MTIQTEHRGYKIIYSENADEWTSLEAGDRMNAPTLSKLKEKIDRMVSSQKKATAVDCVVIESEGYASSPTFVAEARMTAYVGPVLENKSHSSLQKRVKGQKVEVVYASTKYGQKERAARREVELRSCCFDTPEFRAALDAANKIAAEVSALIDKHRKAVAAIPRLTLESIDALVKLSGVDPTGELDAEGRRK